jgi:hypothetical protein
MNEFTYEWEDEISFLGGARIGLANATWPFATLKAKKNKVTLRVLIFGTYSFSPEQVVNLETFRRGVLIQHNVAEYPKHIVFWSVKNPVAVIEDVLSLGFLCKGVVGKKRSGLSLKLFPLFTFFLLLNLIFFYFDSMGLIVHSRHPLGIIDFFFLGLVLLFCLCLKYSKAFAKIFLNRGRHIGEVVHALNLGSFVTSAIIIIGLLSNFFMSLVLR